MYCTSIFLEELRKTMKTSVRIAGVPAETQTEHLPNTSLEHQSNLFHPKALKTLKISQTSSSNSNFIYTQIMVKQKCTTQQTWL
jgi:hypothetical protein